MALSPESACRRTEELEDLLRVCLEFGLFRSGGHSAVAAELESARQAIAGNTLPTAATHLTNAESTLNNEIVSQNLAWRMSVFHQIPLSIYYGAWLAAITWLVLSEGWASPDKVLGIPAAIPVFGALGAVLRGLMWLQFKVTRRQYRPQFLVGHLVGPPIGMLFAAIAYLLLATGVVAMTPEDVKLDRTHLPQLIAFVAGFSWEWITERIRSFTG